MIRFLPNSKSFSLLFMLRCLVCLLLVGNFPLIAAEPNQLQPEVLESQTHLDLSYFIDETGQKQPVKTIADWEKRKAHIRKQMQLVMGPLPNPENAVPLRMKVLEDKQVDGLRRQKIEFHTDSKERTVKAYLFRQASPKKSKPAILCLHQTTGIGKDEPAGLGGYPHLHYALHLAKRGYVTLAPDYPSFGEYEIDFSQDKSYLSGTMRAIYDNQRAVDLLSILPEVDAERIGCIGHSLGGHNTMFTAIFDERIKAIVSNCGFTRFHKYYNGKLQGWGSDRYMPLIRSTYKSNANLVPFDFPEIVGSFAPRAFLASSPIRDDNFEVSGVKDSLEMALPIYKLYNAEDNLQANYPDCAHHFPSDAREVAYNFFDRHLNHTPLENTNR